MTEYEKRREIQTKQHMLKHEGASNDPGAVFKCRENYKAGFDAGFAYAVEVLREWDDPVADHLEDYRKCDDSSQTSIKSVGSSEKSNGGGSDV